MPLAVLVVALVEAAEDYHVVGSAGFLHRLGQEHIGRPRLSDAAPHVHPVVALHCVAHISAGIVACHTLAFEPRLEGIERQSLALHFQRRAATTHRHHLYGILAHDEHPPFALQLQRQHATIVLQQHYALLGYLLGSVIMALAAQESIPALAVHRGAEEEAQHPPHLVVELLFRQFALPDKLFVGIGHVVAVVGIGLAHCQSVGPCAKLHVEPVQHGLHGVVRATPVGHHHAIVAPVAFQYLVEHDVVVAVVLPPVEVVSTHDAPSACLGDCRLESRQINLMERAVVYHYVHLMAVFLIVVERIVLHASGNALRLQPLDIWHHHAAGQIGVFAHVLEVAAVERRAVDVDARPQYHVFAAV